MAGTTKIQWTEATWNPTRGCSRVSTGCENCYAELLARRMDHPGGSYEGLTVLGGKGPRWNGIVREVPDALTQPLQWRKPRMIFVNSMSDLFHEAISDAFIASVFDVMARTPRHTYQILTKRSERMLFTPHLRELPNVWLGVSAENQETYDERVPTLMQTLAAVRWVSAEPLLGPIDLQLDKYPIDWVVVGGESGPNARTCEIGWLSDIVVQCTMRKVSVFVKQLGSRPYRVVAVDAGHAFLIAHGEPDAEDLGGGLLRLRHPKGGDPSEWPHDLRVRQWPERAV